MLFDASNSTSFMVKSIFYISYWVSFILNCFMKSPLKMSASIELKTQHQKAWKW